MKMAANKKMHSEKTQLRSFLSAPRCALYLTGESPVSKVLTLYIEYRVLSRVR